jgi:hypothetical protein
MFTGCAASFDAGWGIHSVHTPWPGFLCSLGVQHRLMHDGTFIPFTPHGQDSYVHWVCSIV